MQKHEFTKSIGKRMENQIEWKINKNAPRMTLQKEQKYRPRAAQEGPKSGQERPKRGP